jgi:UTP--glucose-1-phosphate uridylyltransferase
MEHPLSEFTPEQALLLTRHGFDATEFEEIRRRVAHKELSLEANRETGRVEAPPPDAIKDVPRTGSAEKAAAEAAGREAIARGDLAVVILNGGMATRFGGVVKGVVEVLPSHSFLRLKVMDVLARARECGGRIPIYIMNSFATDAATRAHFAEHGNFGIPAEDLGFFVQSIAPRLTPAGKIFRDADKDPSFYSPGHGDFVKAFRRSGRLAELRAAGCRHVFVSNVDNLGARVSPEIVGLHVLARKQATVEVAPKWPGDQGGAPALVDGKLQVVEGFRFPESFDQDSIPVFNCNTFTFAADALDRDFDLSWYYVEKKIGTKKVVQVERLIGELSRFLDCLYLRVKRTGDENRFFPIKTPSDLEAAREDLAALLKVNA